MIEQNLYFVVPATSQTEAEAIAEAMRIGVAIDAKMPIELRSCGTTVLIAKVFASGKVCVKARE